LLSAARLAGLAIALTLALAGSASAASLSITVTGPGEGPSATATLTGSADKASQLYVYYQPAGTPCGATAQRAQGTPGARSAGAPTALAAGPFSVTQAVGFDVGGNVVCGYVSSASSNPSDPGPFYRVPDAAAVSQPYIGYPCSPKTFSIESVDVAPKAGGSNYYAPATLKIHADGPGGVQLYDPAGETIYGEETVPKGGGSVSFMVTAQGVEPSDKGKSKTQTFTIGFRPASGPRCALPDGTVANDWGAPNQSVSITFKFHGGGSSDVGPSNGAGSTGDAGSGADAAGDDAGSADVPVTVAAQSLAAILAKRTVSAGSVTYRVAGVLTADLLLGKKKAGQLIRVMAKGKPTALKIKLTPAGRAALKKGGKRAKLTARLTFAPATGGAKQVTTRKLALRG
jgi:hypothetical protein